MKILVLLFAISTFFTSTLLGQNCSWLEGFEKVASAIEADYAGLKSKISQYKINYLHLKQRARKEIIKNEGTACYNAGYAVFKYLSIFRDGHISFAQKADSSDIKNFTTGSMFFGALKKVSRYTPQFEGLWYSLPLKTIYRIKKTSEGYSGFIEYSQFSQMHTGDIAFRLFKFGTQYLSSSLQNYYTGGKVLYYCRTKIVYDSLLDFEGAFSLRKMQKNEIDSSVLKKPRPPKKKIELKIVDSTVVISIPTFEYENKAVLDSICGQTKFFSKYKNLILDLRGNSGGTIMCIYPFEKYFYTSPFLYVTGYRSASDSAIKFYEDYLPYITTNDSDYKKEVIGLLGKMKANRGKFIYDTATLITHDTVYKFPAQVGIIVDHNCASAVELVLLAIRGSKKVTVFGETTAGIGDTGEAFDYQIAGCSSTYYLGIPSCVNDFSRYGSIDGVGIKPDYYLDTRANDCILSAIKILKKKNSIE